MHIAVISDIHLGRGDGADRSQGHDQALLRLLDYLEARYELIILLGDVWELLTPKWPGNPKRELRLVRAAHPELAQRFTRAPYRYIVGNHDQAVEILEGLPKEISIKADQVHMIFTHGHQFDVWAHQLRYVGEFVVWVSGWAARLGTQALTRFFDQLHNLITGASEGSQLGGLERNLIKQSRGRNAQVTVMGHTHLPGITEHDGHLLVNSGHCLGSTLHFVSLDTQRHTVTVYRIKQSVNKPLSEHDLSIVDKATLSRSTM
jgi:predicted phosphodiesterase